MRTPTPRDIEAATDRTVHRVKRLWEKQGEVPPALLMLWLGESEGDIEHMQPVPSKFVYPLFGDAAAKDKLMQVIVTMLTVEPPKHLRKDQPGHGRPGQRSLGFAGR